MGVLAPLATAGISALSYQHELKKQFSYIQTTIDRMQKIETMNSELQENLHSLSTDLASWLKRAKSTNLLFDYIADTENTLRHSLRARAVIEEITNQTSVLARGTETDYSQIDDRLCLPEASFAEWGAIFQNVLLMLTLQCWIPLSVSYTSVFVLMKNSEKYSFRILDMELTSKMQIGCLNPSRGHRKFQLKEKHLAMAALDLDLRSFDWLLITSDVVFDLLIQMTDLKRILNLVEGGQVSTEKATILIYDDDPERARGFKDKLEKGLNEGKKGEDFKVRSLDKNKFQNAIKALEKETD